MRRRREGLLEGDPRPEEWGWAVERLELVEGEVAQELSAAGESRPTSADDTSLRTALDLVREARTAVGSSDVRAARAAWTRLEQVDASWHDGPLTERIRSTGVTLFGGVVEIAATPGPPAFLAPPATEPGRARPERPGPTTRDLVIRLVLCAVVVLVTAAGALVAADAALDGYRADTPVRVQAEGCSAAVTGSDGVTRTVSLRVYKGACLQPDADGLVTVHVDADDPSVVVARRWWAWWTLAAAGALVLCGLAARTATRAALGVRRARSGVSAR